MCGGLCVSGTKWPSKLLMGLDWHLFLRHLMAYGLRLEVSAGRAAPGCHRNDLVLFQLQAHPEAWFRFSRGPLLLDKAFMSAVNYEALLHRDVTPDALDRRAHR